MAKATFRTGHSEIGFRNWNLAYLRYISDPQFETRFPLDTMEIGRIDLIKKLYDRLFANNASLFLNMDDPCLRKFCSDSELLFASTQNFFDRPPFSIRDGGLSEVAILSTILSENENQASYDVVKNRVLHVSNSIRIGGAERQVLFSTKAPIVESQLALYNISRNNKENSFITEVEKSGIIVHDYSIEPSSNFHTNCSSSLSLIPDGPGLNPWMTVQIKSLIDIFSKERPEIVHLWQDGTNIIGGIAAILSGVPRIFLSARSTPPFSLKNSQFPDKGASYYLHNRYSRKMYQYLLDFENVQIIFNSRVCADFYFDWLGLDPDFDRFRVIPNAVMTEAGAKEKPFTKNNNKIVGGVFRLKEVKQPILWLQVAEYVINNTPENVQFVILGDGPLWEKCNQWIEDSRLSNRITMVGFTDSVDDWMQTFDVLLQTSVVEGLPNTLIEAQYCGVPVVTTDSGGSKETIVDGVTGFCSSGFEVKELGDLVLTALFDENWSENAKKESKIWARKNFSLDKMHHMLLSLYGVEK